MSQHPPHSQPYGQGTPPYGGQSYGYSNPHAAGGGHYGGGLYSGNPPRRGGRGGKIAFFIGLALFVIGGIILVASAVSLYGSVSGVVQQGGTGFAETAQVEATAGTTYMIIAQQPTNATCDVTGPDGASVHFDTSASTTINDGNTEASIIGGFTAANSGTHQLDCSGAQSFLFAEMDIGKLGLASLGLLGGIALGFIGFVVGLIGLIAWLVGRQKVIY